MNKIKELIYDYGSVINTLLILATFSGAFRKWAGFSSMTNNIFLLLLMVIPIYLLFFFKNKFTKFLNKGLKNLLYIFLFILILLAAHPLNLTYFHGLFGILVHLVFIAIILSYLKNIETFDEKKVISLFFTILITQLIIGSIQYNSPTDSIINRYADNRQEVNNEEEFVYASAKVGDAVRVTGTFSYLGGYTAVVFFMLLFIFYLSKTKTINYFFILSPLIFYTALLSGSRGCVGFTLILLVAFIVSERKLIVKNTRTIFITVIGIIFLIGVNIVIGDEFGIIKKVEITYENFISRVETNESEGQGRLTNDLIQVFTRDFNYRYTGVGLGSTYQGVNALFGTSSIVENTAREGELFRILIEGSIFLVLFRWFFLIIIFSYLSIPMVLRVTLFLFFCVFSQNVFHIYNAIYFSVGLIILNQAYIKKPLEIENNNI